MRLRSRPIIITCAALWVLWSILLALYLFTNSEFDRNHVVLPILKDQHNDWTPNERGLESDSALLLETDSEHDSIPESEPVDTFRIAPPGVPVVVRVIGNDLVIRHHTIPQLIKRLKVIHEYESKAKRASLWVIYRIVDPEVMSAILKLLQGETIHIVEFDVHEYSTIQLLDTPNTTMDHVHFTDDGFRWAFRTGVLKDFQNLFYISRTYINMTNSITALYSNRISYLTNTEVDFKQICPDSPVIRVDADQGLNYQAYMDALPAVKEKQLLRISCNGKRSSNCQRYAKNDAKESTALTTLLKTADSLKVREVYNYDPDRLVFFNHEILFAEQKAYRDGTAPASLKLLVKQTIVPIAKLALPFDSGSVLEKTIPPPSSDFHDYLSPEYYCWPKSTESYFPCDVVDGKPYIAAVLFSNESYIFDHSRRAEFFHRTLNLAFAWFFTGEEQYGRKATKNIESWFLNDKTRMNPNLDFAQWRGEAKFGSIVDFVDMATLLDCIRLLHMGGMFSAQSMTKMRVWTSEYVEWMNHAVAAGQDYSSSNNHGLIYDLEYVTVASFAKETLGDMLFILDRSKYRVFTQIAENRTMPHEMQRPLCEHYQVFTLQLFHQLARVSKNFGNNLLELPIRGIGDRSAICTATEYSVPHFNPKRGTCPGGTHGVPLEDWFQAYQYGVHSCGLETVDTAFPPFDIYELEFPVSGMLFWENLGMNSRLLGGPPVRPPKVNARQTYTDIATKPSKCLQCEVMRDPEPDPNYKGDVPLAQISALSPEKPRDSSIVGFEKDWIYQRRVMKNVCLNQTNWLILSEDAARSKSIAGVCDPVTHRTDANLQNTTFCKSFKWAENPGYPVNGPPDWGLKPLFLSPTQVVDAFMAKGTYFVNDLWVDIHHIGHWAYRMANMHSFTNHMSRYGISQIDGIVYPQITAPTFDWEIATEKIALPDPDIKRFFGQDTFNDKPTICFETVVASSYHESYFTIDDASNWRKDAYEYFGIESSGTCPPAKLAILHRDSDPNRPRKVLNSVPVQAALELLLKDRPSVTLERVEVTGTWTAEEQARFFASFGLLLTPHSSQLSNLMFVQENVAALELIPVEITQVFQFLGWKMGMDYRRLVSPKLAKSDLDSDAKLAEAVEACFSDDSSQCSYGKSKLIKDKDFYVDIEQLTLIVRSMLSELDRVCGAKWGAVQ